jgi:hypothetical protein
MSAAANKNCATRKRLALCAERPVGSRGCEEAALEEVMPMEFATVWRAL